MGSTLRPISFLVSLLPTVVRIFKIVRGSQIPTSTRQEQQQPPFSAKHQWSTLPLSYHSHSLSLSRSSSNTFFTGVFQITARTAYDRIHWHDHVSTGLFEDLYVNSQMLIDAWARSFKLCLRLRFFSAFMEVWRALLRFRPSKLLSMDGLGMLMYTLAHTHTPIFPLDRQTNDS